eukprot:gene13477-18078_t
MLVIANAIARSYAFSRFSSCGIRVALHSLLSSEGSFPVNSVGPTYHTNSTENSNLYNSENNATINSVDKAATNIDDNINSSSMSYQNIDDNINDQTIETSISDENSNNIVENETIITSNLQPLTTTNFSNPQFSVQNSSLSQTEEERLLEKYKGKFVICEVPEFPYCDIYLCGTLHVAKTSLDMVQEVVSCLMPEYTIVELCEARIDSLFDFDEPVANLTISEVFRSSFKDKSLKTFGMGLLSWMQLKAAKVMGNKLGGELAIATKETHKYGGIVILGDRLYNVTIQRIFDRLKLFEKIKMVFILIWESITMSLFKITDYISKTEHDDQFIRDEIQKFSKHLPAFVDVIINERDEYLSASIREVAKVGISRLISSNPTTSPYQSHHPSMLKRAKIISVVGAGHLDGIRKHLKNGGLSYDRLREISSSSKHVESTWPGSGMLHVVNPIPHNPPSSP